jgi:hypothetical protein
MIKVYDTEGNLAAEFMRDSDRIRQVFDGYLSSKVTTWERVNGERTRTQKIHTPVLVRVYSEPGQVLATVHLQVGWEVEAPS